EELIWRGFQAETTIKDPATLDTRESKKFYWGADPSADSLTIGNLAALMMCACFVRHGYEPTLLVGGATGQIGDPKETGERDLKSLNEVEHNKQCIKRQIEKIMGIEDARLVDNYDWFKDINYLDFLREVGKTFSMTQLLDRQFIQARIGEGGSGISYAEFSYTLIQGYDFLYLYRKYGISLQLCGADQFGNCSSGIHLIKRLENAAADAWSTPLVIDPVTGRKFGKSEGNAVWLASTDNGSGNYTSVFDFYQFWLNQPDEAVEYLLKIYTIYNREMIESTLAEHKEHPEQRLAQKLLARGATEVVHGKTNAEAAVNLTNILFGGQNINTFSASEIENITLLLPMAPLGTKVVDALVETGLAASKKEANRLLSSGAISINSEKVFEDAEINTLAILKRGKNKFAIIK
ncbi:tyrosine--tRNA ligase, partial [Candidatus Saccharibacteria bacterium]|nr:tyrosine--tRNA ligase [Candidatus Saccharibacteria bacterium]